MLWATPIPSWSRLQTTSVVQEEVDSSAMLIKQYAELKVTEYRIP